MDPAAAAVQPSSSPLETQRAAFRVAIEQGDAARLAALYTSDARLVAPAVQPMHGRSAVEAFWRAGIDAGICDFELEPIEQEHDDRIACEIGRYLLRVRPAEGPPVVERGHYVVILGREADGSWLRALEMFNPAQQAAEGTGVLT